MFRIICAWTALRETNDLSNDLSTDDCWDRLQEPRDPYQD